MRRANLVLRRYTLAVWGVAAVAVTVAALYAAVAGPGPVAPPAAPHKPAAGPAVAVVAVVAPHKPAAGPIAVVAPYKVAAGPSKDLSASLAALAADAYSPYQAILAVMQNGAWAHDGVRWELYGWAVGGGLLTDAEFVATALHAFAQTLPAPCRMIMRDDLSTACVA